MTNNEFHVPFIKSLIFVAVFTLVSMSLVHYFLSPKFFSETKSPNYTSQQSQIQTYSSESKLIGSNSH